MRHCVSNWMRHFASRLARHRCSGADAVVQWAAESASAGKAKRILRDIMRSFGETSTAALPRAQRVPMQARQELAAAAQVAAHAEAAEHKNRARGILSAHRRRWRAESSLHRELRGFNLGKKPGVRSVVGVEVEGLDGGPIDGHLPVRRNATEHVAAQDREK